jgi:DNA-directed RNA polymerase specialized sigma24 family protein
MTVIAPSFEDVYRTDYARLVRAASRRTGSRETAEEVVQDAFVALYPRFEDVGETGDPVRYVSRSVINGCTSHHRRRGVAQRLHHLVAAPDVDAPDVEVDETWLPSSACRAAAATWSSCGSTPTCPWPTSPRCSSARWARSSRCCTAPWPNSASC